MLLGQTLLCRFFARTERYDAALLDINMSGLGGIETCRAIRRLAPRLPILMLTVRDNPDDKIDALDAGADDYLTKPFHVGELMARVRSAVRRSQATQENQDAVITIGDIELDSERRLVRKTGDLIHLTPKELDLLRCLMLQPGKPLTHGRLLTSVWGTEYRNEFEYLRTFVRQLRWRLMATSKTGLTDFPSRIPSAIRMYSWATLRGSPAGTAAGTQR